MKEQVPCRSRHDKVAPKLDPDQGQSLHRLATSRPKVADIEGMASSRHGPEHVGAARSLAGSTHAVDNIRSQIATQIMGLR